MKKTVIFFLAGFCFALPALAQNTVQNAQKAASDVSPVQVYVTINNSTSAQGNSQTTTIDNNQNQANTQTTAVNAQPAPAVKAPVDLKGADTLYGNYYRSPYKSNFQVEMLRHTTWGMLVPRKKLYQDPAKGRYPLRYSAAKPVKVEKKETQAANSIQKNTVSGVQEANTGVDAQNGAHASMTENVPANMNDSQKKTAQNSLYEPVKNPSASASSGDGSKMRRNTGNVQDNLLVPKL